MDCLKMKNTVSEMTNILGRIINRVDTPQQTSHPLAWFPFWVGLKLSPAGWRPDHRAFI